MRTFFTPSRGNVGDDPLKPGLCIPRLGSVDTRGFFKLDRSGPLANDAELDPFEENVVDMDTMLPFVPLTEEYGFPLASVIETV